MPRYYDSTDLDWIRQQLVPLHAKGLSDRQAAAKLGVAFSTVYNWRKRLRLLPNYPAGSEAQAKAIRESHRCYRRDNGYTRSDRLWQLNRLAALDAGWPAGMTKERAWSLRFFERFGSLTCGEWCLLSGQSRRQIPRLVNDGWLVTVDKMPWPKQGGSTQHIYDLSPLVKECRARHRCQGEAS